MFFFNPDFTFLLVGGEKNTENPCHNKTREAWFKQSVGSAGSAACQKVKPLIQTCVHKWYRSLFSCRFQKIPPPSLKSVRWHNIVRALRCALLHGRCGIKKASWNQDRSVQFAHVGECVSVISYFLQITCKQIYQYHVYTFALRVAKDTEGIARIVLYWSCNTEHGWVAG